MQGSLPPIYKIMAWKKSHEWTDTTQKSDDYAEWKRTKYTRNGIKDTFKQ